MGPDVFWVWPAELGIVAVGGSVLALAAAIGVWLATRRKTPAPSPRAAVARDSATVSNQPAAAASPAGSPPPPALPPDRRGGGTDRRSTPERRVASIERPPPEPPDRRTSTSDRRTIERRAATPTGPTSDDPDDLTNQIMGRYRLIEKVGAGNMAVVYRAEPMPGTATVKREVTLGGVKEQKPEFAVKIVKEELGRDPEFRERFQREAELCSKFKHPSLMKVHEFGEHNGRLYFVMDFVKGTTLRDKIRPQGMPMDEAMHYLRQILRGMSEAHRAGIVHRDIKPDNIMVGAKNLVKIMDFGLAKGKESANTTQVGVVLGTPEYVAPERTRQGDVDARSDQYSLGCVIYEMLIGIPPFRDKKPYATLLRHMNDPVPPMLTLRPDLPLGVEPIVKRMLEKTPSARYDSVDDVLAALESAFAADRQL